MTQLKQPSRPASHTRLRWRAALVLLPLLLVAGCRGDRVQSSLHPSGPAAEAVARLWWVLLAILGIYSVAVFALTLVAIFRRQADEPTSSGGGRAFILVGGVILPAIILVPLLIYSVSATAALRMRDGGLTIRVVGHRWWWEVEYPEQNIVTANEIYIPVGEPVRLEMTASDVIHSFWVPQLHGKTDMLPDHVTVSWLQADRPGVYRGQCAEYCGTQHAHMAFEVIALPPEEFVAWLARNTATRREPLAPAARTGEQAFFQHGCAVCHAIQGTLAVGRAGPDLTLIGARKTLAAATLPNTGENLLAWIIDPQAFKPGVKMPPTHAPVEDLELIVAYLQTLDGEGGDDESER